MKKIAVLITLLFVTVGVQAQNADKAKKLLDEVSAKIKGYSNIALDFTYQNGQQEIDGKATIQGEKYVVEFMGVTQLFDGSKIYVINPNDEEVTIASAQSGNAQTVSVAQLLTFYKSGYTYAWDKTQNVAGKTIQYVKLTPLKKSDVKEIYLGIDTKNKQIYNRTDVYKSGNKSIITVKSFKTNQALSKNHFTFTKSKYPNYYINNLD